MAHLDPRGSPKVVLLTVAAFAIALVLACDQPTPTSPSGHGTTPQPHFSVGDPITVSLTPAEYIGWAPWVPGVLQSDTVTAVLSSPVSSVYVGGHGRVACDNPEPPGAYGGFIAYDSSGNELGRGALRRWAPGPISNPGSTECGDPNAPGGSTYDATWDVRGDTITVSTPSIVRVKITPFTKGFEFTNYDVLGNPYPDKAYLEVGVGFPPPPAPHIRVNCTPATPITRASANVSCTASATGGALAVQGWIFTPTDPAVGSVIKPLTTVTWAGLAVASGDVTVQGTVGGVAAVSDTGRFTVTNRTTGWSWSAAKSADTASRGKYDCITYRHYQRRPTYGWATADTSCRRLSLFLWPDYEGKSSARGYKIEGVPAGPNTGLWYAVSDSTSMRLRAQVLRDIRPDDGYKDYPGGGKDTVGTRCKAAGVTGQQRVTVINNVCMTDSTNAFNFAAMYAATWRHERCHLKQSMDVFPSIPDPRTRLEAIVRSDTAAFHFAAAFFLDGFKDANDSIGRANTIDTLPTQAYTFWSRDSTNTVWQRRTLGGSGILPSGC